VAFRITLAEGSWSTDDLTLAEVVGIEQETGESWVYMNPLRSAVQARAIVRRLLARDSGLDDATKRVDKMRVVDVVAAIEPERDGEDDRPKSHVDGMPEVDPKEETDGSATT